MGSLRDIRRQGTLENRGRDGSQTDHLCDPLTHESCTSVVTAIKKARRSEKANKKRWLAEQVLQILTRHEGAPDYLLRSVGDLNERGIVTLTGRPWDTRNLWHFTTTNAELFHQVAQNRGATASQELGEIHDGSPESSAGSIDELIDWAMRFRDYGIVPIHVSDTELLERIQKRLGPKAATLSALVEGLLRDWEARQG